MVSKLFSVAALAGAAMAACPLSVDIVGVTDHTVQVAVKNTANEAVTVFKGNTVLSEHATKDLLVSDASMSLAFND
jgi:deuterolysin